MAKTVVFTANVTDEQGNRSVLTAQGVYNEGPVIDGIDIAQVNASLQVTIRARDPEGGVLTYALTASEGTIALGPQPNVFIWTP